MKEGKNQVVVKFEIYYYTIDIFYVNLIFNCFGCIVIII